VQDGFEKTRPSGGRPAVELQPPPPPPPPAPEEKPVEKKAAAPKKGWWDKAVDKGKDLAGDVKDTAVDVKNKVVEEGKDLAGDVKDTAIEVKDKVVEEGGNAVDALKGKVEEWKESVDYKKSIDNLGPGDTYSLHVAGDVSIETGKAYGKADLECTRNDKGEYIVSADGELGAGLYGMVGGSAGAKAKVEGEATAGVGAKVEMKFASAEEAKRAMDTLVRSTTPGGALLGPPSTKDLEFSMKHVSAVEVRGAAAAKLAGEAGVGVRGAADVGAFAEAGVELQVSARIEFDANRKPSLVIKEELSGNVTAGAEAGLPGGQTKSGVQTGSVLGQELSGSLKGSLTIETKVDMPGNVDPLKLVQDPVGALADVGKQQLRSLETTATVKVQAEGTAGSVAKGGVEGTFVLKTNAGEKLDAKVLDAALHGEFRKAAAASAGSTQVEATVQEYKSVGVSAAPELKFMGFGVKGEFAATTRDVSDTPLFSFKGSAKDAATAIGGWGTGSGKALGGAVALSSSGTAGLSEAPSSASLNKQLSTGRYAGGVRA
ncbi:YtxH domain-containing protein, partial [Corallococcus carmarthensis]